MEDSGNRCSRGNRDRMLFAARCVFDKWYLLLANVLWLIQMALVLIGLLAGSQKVDRAGITGLRNFVRDIGSALGITGKCFLFLVVREISIPSDNLEYAYWTNTMTFSIWGHFAQYPAEGIEGPLQLGVHLTADIFCFRTTEFKIVI